MRGDGLGRAAAAALGMASVVPLLAWVYGVVPFHVGVLAFAVPGLVGLVIVYVVSGRRGWDDTRTAIVVGAFAGLIGTLGYDLVRVPFVFGAGLRLLSPIESYGVLALDANTSSPSSDFAGWVYHVSNGVGFGIAYAAMALRRHWLAGLAWAMVLETATLATPFASAYGLWGNHDAITLAYLAHIPYGLALGLIVQHADAWRDGLDSLGRFALPTVLVVVVLGLALWLQPLSSLDWARTHRLPPAVVIEDGRFVPEWSRVAPDGCIIVHNRDGEDYMIGAKETSVPAGSAGEVCFEHPGVHRVRTGAQMFDGGFVIVDSDW